MFVDVDNLFSEIVKLDQDAAYYLNWYNKIIDSAKIRGLDKSKLDYYTEEHHILPKCKGGTNEDSNLVLLTAKEHIVVHILLYRAEPNNPLIVHAANCMVLLRNSKERSLEIDKLELNTLAELRELSGKLLRKPIVCYLADDSAQNIESITICKIFDSIVDAVNAGFDNTQLYKAIINGRQYGGYFWMKLSDAEEEIPNAILEYRNRVNDKEIQDLAIYHEKRKQVPRSKNRDIICYKEEGDLLIIYRIYNRLSDSNKDGFCIYNVCNVLSGKRDNCLGYKWKYLDEFEELDSGKILIEEFKKLSSDEYPKLEFPTNKVICCDSSKNIIRIYNTLSESKLEGFSPTYISASLKDKGSGVCVDGYFWYKFLDWPETEKLEEFIANNKLPKIINNKRAARLSPHLLIKSDAIGNVDEIYNSIECLPDIYKDNTLRRLLRVDIDSSNLESRKYKDYYWFRALEFNEIFPGKLDRFLICKGLNESIEKSATVLNLALTVSTKLISVNELYKAHIVNKGGRSYPALYKNPKANKVSEEIRNQLLAVDFSKYIDWLKKTKKYSITINFVLKSGISQRDCANFEKIMCDDLVKFIKNDLGISHFDDSEFLELRLVKSIIPNAHNEYALIQLKESKHDVRFDHIDEPEKIYLAGPIFPTEIYNWKEEIVPYLIARKLDFYDPIANFLDIEKRSIEKYDKCNVILYMLYPSIFDQAPSIISDILYDIELAMENGNHSFVWVGIMGNLEDWGLFKHQIEFIYNYIEERSSDCSRLRVKFISNPEEILEP